MSGIFLNQYLINMKSSNKSQPHRHFFGVPVKYETDIKTKQIKTKRNETKQIEMKRYKT